MEVTIHDIPLPVMERYRSVMLGANVMTINKICFVVSISHHIKFRTGEVIGNTKVETLAQSLKRIQRVYMQRGFRITEARMDGQFKPLWG